MATAKAKAKMTKDAARSVRTTDPKTASGATDGTRQLALLFSGQGSQRLHMGRELYAESATFAAAFDEACECLDPLLGFRLRRELFEGDLAALLRQDVAQPALFALEVALFRMVEDWGVRPTYVLGHSVGEIAAAHAAGVLSLSDAAVLVSARGRLMEQLPEGGAMAAVLAGEDQVLPLLGSEVTIAAVNGPNSLVLAGNPAALGAVLDELTSFGVRSRQLQVRHAFHSHLVEPLLDDLREVADRLSPRPPRLGLVSTLTGAEVSEEMCSPDYWVRQVRGAVRFLDGVRALEAAGVSVFLGLGPDEVMTAMAKGCLRVAEKALLLAVLRRETSEVASSLLAADALAEQAQARSKATRPD